MLRKVIIALSSLAMLAATLVAPGAPEVTAQNNAGLRVITEFQVPGSRDVKYPSVVAANNFVHVAGNINRNDAVVWSKGAAATSFPDPFELGPAEGQPDFSTTALAAGPDGSIYVAWINNPARTIFMRRRDPSGSWGPTRTVERSGSFLYKPAIGVSSTGQIFVAWLIPEQPARYRFSTDGGANWGAGSRRVDDDIVAYNSVIGLAGGPNGSMAITFTEAGRAGLVINVGLWNGNQFALQRVTGSGDYADSSVSIGPDGKVYVAYRGVAERGGNSGVFYAERASNGTWPRSRLVSEALGGTVTVSADEGNNLHFTWVRADRLFYAFKPATSAPVGPITSGRVSSFFNPRGYGSVGTTAYNHVVTEQFTGAGLRTFYTLFEANASLFGGDPVVENDAARTSRSTDSTVLLTFRNLTGSPDQVRYAWNRAPNDTDPWVPFAPTLRVPVPDSIYNSTGCELSTLYTQLRNSATNQIESQARSDALQIDGVVEAVVVFDNATKRTTPADASRLGGPQGAPGGATTYTRTPFIYVDVEALTDCNGLSSLGFGTTPNAPEASYPIGEGGFEGIVPLPNAASLQPGIAYPYYIRVTDGVGNVRVFEHRIILDTEKPVLNLAASGPRSVAPNALGDILQDLTFTNLNIRDAIYQNPADPDPSRRFWGFWIANSPDQVADPLNDPKLRWQVVEAPPSVAVPNGAAGIDYTVTLKGWSLAAGLTKEQRAAGDFFIYVRFLDGAGNPTDDYLSFTVAASQMQLLETALPVVRR